MLPEIAGFFNTGKYYNWESSYKVSRFSLDDMVQYTLEKFWTAWLEKQDDRGLKGKKRQEQKNKWHKTLESITTNPEIRQWAAPGRSVLYQLGQIVYCEGQSPEKSLELFLHCRIHSPPNPPIRQLFSLGVSSCSKTLHQFLLSEGTWLKQKGAAHWGNSVKAHRRQCSVVLLELH